MELTRETEKNESKLKGNEISYRNQKKLMKAKRNQHAKINLKTPKEALRKLKILKKT